MMVAATMIVKNEERDLPRALHSIARIVDRLVILDTGSTDGTARVAYSVDVPTTFRRYLLASERDAAGDDWKLWDFAKARNAAIDTAERAGADWILWIDADDELVDPWALYGAMARSDAEVLAVTIESGGARWTQHRAWRAGLGIRFVGRCHEYPDYDARRVLALPGCVIRHHPDPTGGEGSAERNLRILLREWAENPSARTAFYLANTYRDLGRWDQAARWYVERIAGFDVGYRDEWLFALLYSGRCYRAAGQIEAAVDALENGSRAAPEWSEFPMERAYIAADFDEWDDAATHARAAIRDVIPPTLLWREPDKYGAEPRKMLERCRSHGIAV